MSGDEREECQSCGYPAEEMRTYDVSARPARLLCELCACTLIGNITAMPSVYRTESALATSIAWIGNRILDEMRGRAKP